MEQDQNLDQILELSSSSSSTMDTDELERTFREPSPGHDSDSKDDWILVTTDPITDDDLMDSTDDECEVIDITTEQLEADLMDSEEEPELIDLTMDESMDDD